MEIGENNFLFLNDTTLETSKSLTNNLSNSSVAQRQTAILTSDNHSEVLHYKTPLPTIKMSNDKCSEN